MRQRFLTAALLLAACAWQAPATAALSEVCKAVEAKLAALPPAPRLSALFARDCLGGDADTADPVTRQFVDDLPDAKNGKTIQAGKSEQKFVVVDELGELAKAAREEAGRRVAQANEGAVLRKLAERIDAARAEVKADTDLATAGPHQAGRWEWDTQEHGFPALPTVDVRGELLGPACQQPAAAACASAYGAGQHVLRLARLTQRTLTYYATPVLKEAAEKAARRHAQWTSYFDDARMQYPHELWINGKLWARAAKEKRGFAEAPDYQVIFLHPNVGLEYIRNAEPGSRLAPSIFLEWIGFNKFSYDRDTHKVSGGLGVSLIRAYTDTASLQSTANGVMLHWRQRYSIAATRRDGKTGIVLSVDLANVLDKAGQDVRDSVRFARSLF
jgi:hypothetical protein